MAIRKAVFEGQQVVDFGDGWEFQTHLPPGLTYAPGRAGRQGIAIDEQRRQHFLDPVTNEWMLADDIAARSVPGVAAGFGQSVGNVFGVDVDVEGLNEADVNIGNALATGAAVTMGGMAGAAGGAALAGLWPGGSLGASTAVTALPFLGDLAGGSAAAFATAESGEGGEAAGSELRENLIFSGLTALAAKGTSMAVRTVAAIANMRQAKRTIDVGGGEISQQAVERLQNQGFEITPGQASDDVQQLLLEDANRGRPLQAGPFEDIDRGNEQVFNATAARSIGLDTSGPRPVVLDPDTLRQAGDDIVAEMDDVVNGIGGVNVDDTILDPIRKISEQGDLSTGTRSSIKWWLDNFQNSAEGGVGSAQTWREQRKRISESGASAKDDKNRQAIHDVLDLWDELPLRTLERQGDSAGAQLFKDRYASAREQYRNWLVLTNGRAVDPNGKVSPALTRRGLETTFRKTFTLNNRDDLVNQETADFHQQTRDLANPRMKPRVGNSGTATRMAADIGLDRNLESLQRMTSNPSDIGPIAEILGRAVGGIAPRFRLAPELNQFGLGISRFGGASAADLLLQIEENERRASGQGVR